MSKYWWLTLVPVLGIIVGLILKESKFIKTYF